MFGKILFLIFALVTQELVLLNALLFAAHKGLYSAILLFVLFIVATIIDILVGFLLGKKFRHKTEHTKLSKYIAKQSERFSFSKSNPKRWLTMLVLGNISFCYINAAIAGYLELPFWESQAYNFLGNIVSYILLWYAVGSLNSIFKNSYASLFVIVTFTLLILLFLRSNRVKKL